MAFEGMTKKEIKQMKKNNKEETRSDGVTFDSADNVEEDDNQMFGGWDYV